MVRRSSSLILIGSLLVLFTTFAAACTDPNIQPSDPHSFQAPPSEHSRLSR